MESSSDVKEAYVQFLAALNGGDAGAVVARIDEQPGALFFGSAAEEWFTGPAMIGEMMGQIVPMLQHAGLTFHPGDPQAFREGTIGWVADRITIRAASGGEQEMRATAIFRQEDGQWKTVLYGHSLAVPDDQVEIFRNLAG